MVEFLLLRLPLGLYVPLLICFIVEFLTLYVVFSVKSVPQGIKLFFVVLLGNTISAILLFPLIFIWFGTLPDLLFGLTIFIKSGVVHQPVFLLSFYFVLIGVFTLIKLGVIALTLKKARNQFFGWLLTINIIIVAMGMYVLLIQFGLDGFFDRLRMVALSGPGEFFNAPIMLLPFAFFIYTMIKFSIVAIGLRKIMSVITILVVFFNTVFTHIISLFVMLWIGVFLEYVVIFIGKFLNSDFLFLLSISDFLFLLFMAIYYLVILPLLEGVVGWMLLKENLLNSRYNTVKKFILLMVVANIAGIIGGIITFFVLPVFFTDVRLK